MTPFIFTKVEEQYKLKDAVKFTSVDQEKAIVASTDHYSVSQNSCSCSFFSSMILPCRHLFQFLSVNNFELFVPNVCTVRWTRKYYNESHPVLNSNTNIIASKPIYVNTIRVPEEKDRYKKTAKITSQINNISANLSTGRFTYFMEKMQSLKNEMMGESEAAQQLLETRTATVVEPNDILTVMQQEFANFLNSASQIVSPNSSVITSTITSAIASANSHSVASISTDTTAEIMPESNLSLSNCGVPVTNISKGNEVSSLGHNTQLGTILSTNNLRRIRLPSKIVSVGRPKGSKTTVIGTKRKGTNLNSPAPSKKPFLERFEEDQAVTILQWLTNMTRSDIVRKKILASDIVGGADKLNRLRNSDIISLDCLKKFVDSKSFEFISTEIEGFSQSPWNCAKCKHELNGDQVMCSSCLDWFHFKCVGFAESKEKDYFCPKC